MDTSLLSNSDKSLIEHHVYHEWYLNLRAGGPPGYLANLLNGLNQLSHYDHPLIVFDTFQGSAPSKNKSKQKFFIRLVESVFKILPTGSKCYNRYLSRSLKVSFDQMNGFLSTPIYKWLPSEELTNKIDLSLVKTIHVHTVPDVLKIKNYLREHFRDDIKVILTCHTPESIANEQYASNINDGQPEERARVLADKWLIAEKKAYEEADIIIFPSPEAEEPLLHDIPEFKDIISKKDIRYMASGCKPLKSSLTKEQAKEKYGVSGKFVVGYVGRHNSIKGYDMLKDAAKKILPNTDNLCFLIGGAPSSTISPLFDPNWIEAGWVNPADLLRALDVFVLPNRQTYYDLILLEVLSMGVPVIATATGGNKSVKKIANDLILCEPNADSLAGAIKNVCQLNESELAQIGHNLFESYQKNFTEVCMAERYVETIDKIYKDYNLYP